MSYFILYFEDVKKKKYNDHIKISEASSVIDKEIYEGKIDIKFGDQFFKALVIASRMDASLFYVYQRPIKMLNIAINIRKKLFSFIHERMVLPINAYFFVFDLKGAWPKYIPINEKPGIILINELDSFFKKGVQIGLFQIKSSK